MKNLYYQYISFVERSRCVQLISFKRIKIHIISGFLGAGKTTLLAHLLKQKPEQEVWAVLINEFGQIGIDQLLLAEQSRINIKEVLGGCLCCSSQLPMQLALSQLIKQIKPDRLFIEPTGLGHVQQLLQQLSQPQWSSQLDLRAVLCVVNASQVQQHGHSDLFQAQLSAANMVFYSHLEHATAQDYMYMQDLEQDYLGRIFTWVKAPLAKLQLALIDRPAILNSVQKQHLLTQQQRMPDDGKAVEIQQLPYFYTQQAQGFVIRGWRFSRRWQFDLRQLIHLLMALQDWLRIKAVLYTDQGWISLNVNPEQALQLAEQIQQIDTQIDNRIEIIDQCVADWSLFEVALLNCCITQDKS